MNAGLLVVGALLLCVYLYTKLKSLFYKAKTDELVKEDATLKSQQNVLEQEVNKLRQDLNNPVKDLTPEEVENFWKEDKK